MGKEVVGSDKMKVNLEASDKQELLDEIIEELKSPDDNKRWGGFNQNPIQKAFKKEANKTLEIIIADILNEDEFKVQLAEVGRKYVRKWLSDHLGVIK